MVDLITLWHFLRLRWWLILLPLVVVTILTLPTLATSLNPQQHYTVAMRFTAAAPSNTPPTYEDSAYVPWLASEYVVVNLPQWVTSDSFAREVSEALASLAIDADDLRPAFHADAARSI